MNIAYACDNNFVDVMCVSIMSFNDHNCDANIYILDCGIEDVNKQKILELCSRKNAVFFIDAKKTLDGLDYNLNLDRGSIAAYARLFIGSVLPQKVDKVLYIDCDTLVNDSLKELYEMKLNDNVLGGVRDAFSFLNKKVFGLGRGEIFINSGVLLINLDAYRKKEIEVKITELLNKQESIFQGDQGIINSIIRGQIKEIPLRYNVQTYLYDFSYKEMLMYRKPDDYFTEEEVEEAVGNPGIVHFSTCFKSNRPWNASNGLKHPYYNDWNLYYKRTGGTKVDSNKKKLLQPSKITLSLIGIMHAYLRPLHYLAIK